MNFKTDMKPRKATSDINYETSQKRRTFKTIEKKNNHASTLSNFKSARQNPKKLF